MSIHTRLRELGLQLPHAAAPVASYQPVVVDGHTAYVSGQLPFVDGKLVTGKLGETVTLEQGQEAARACGLASMSASRSAAAACNCGSLRSASWYESRSSAA